MDGTVRRTTSPRALKFLGTVGERQIRVIASDATPDRMGDILDPNGVELSQYRRNPIVLAQHDAGQPIARCGSIAVDGDKVVALIDFPPEGVSARSDEYLRLCKAGILGAVSVGFLPHEWEPIRGAGYRFTRWEMLELSIVSVPANPSALITERSVGGDRATAERLARARSLQAGLGRGATHPAPVPELHDPDVEAIEAKLAHARNVHRLAMERRAGAMRANAAVQWW